jgi:hypothetical protein
MSTVGSVVEAVGYELGGSQREEHNTLAAAMTSGDTSLTTTYDLEGMVGGAYIAIDDEVIYVWTGASKAATVRRGMLGTTAAAHDSGALITVNPAFPRGIVKQRMKEELRSWPAGIFGVATTTLVGSTSNHTSVLDLGVVSSGIRRILAVREDRHHVGWGSYETWPMVRAWEFVTDRDGADSAQLHIGGRLRGTSVWVAYAADFDYAAMDDDDSDLTTDVLVPASCEDILRMGTAMRMIPHREALRGRADAQGQPRDAAEVQAGQNSQTAILYKTLRDQRLAEEAARLREKWPTVGG